MRPNVVLAAGAIAILFSACGGDSPTTPTPPPTPTCTYQLTASTTTVPADGGSATIGVTTHSSCSWTAHADASWATISSGSSGTGPGTITLTFAGNQGTDSRDAMVSVADQSMRVTQSGRMPCDYAISPETQRFGPDGGDRTVSLTTGGHCRWTATSSDEWLTVMQSEGIGSATLTYLVAPWTGLTERSATIRIATRTLTVRQDGDVSACTYTVSPLDFVLHWHGQQNAEVQVRTREGCPWTTTAGAGWIELSGPARQEGDGVVRFTAGTYTSDGSRRAPIEIRWPTPTQGQNVWITQEGCRYGLSETARSFPAGGGTAQATVVTQAVSPSCALDCPWTATPSASWIRILSGSPNAGDNPFRYEVLPNTTGAPRTATIAVQDLILTVTQF